MVLYPDHLLIKLTSTGFIKAWGNFLHSLESTKPDLRFNSLIDNTLETQYNAYRAFDHIQFKSESDLTFFLLKFS
jgi:hypothetical protein